MSRFNLTNPKRSAQTLSEEELQALKQEQIKGLQVKPGTVSDWLKATTGAHMPARVKGEKVVELRAVPPSGWGML